MSYQRKHYDYRIYDSGTYVTTWSKEAVSEPAFRLSINGGAGEMIVRLDRDFDDFGEEVDVKLFNKVELICFDRDAVDGTLIYTGYISGYRPVLDNHSEYVEITILPYLTEMSKIIYRASNGATTIAQNSQDPTDIFKDIIDKYRADSLDKNINYTDSSVDTTGTTVSYTFQCYSVKEALDKTIELTPEDWYWLVGADNTVYLKESDMDTADHSFLIGKHIKFMETWRRAEDLVNRVYFVGAESGGENLYRVKSNTASVDSYGINAMKKTDLRVSVTDTADIMSGRLINRKKDPEIRTTVVILDNNGSDEYRGYDIESILPGQTMNIKNIKQATKTVSLWDIAQWDVDVWDQTLTYSAADIIQILSVDYSPNAVRIEASSRLPEIAKRMEDIYRNWEESETLTLPSSPTAA